MDAIAELRAVESRLKDRLKGNPDFIAWSAVRKAINEITGTPGYNAPPAPRVRVRQQVNPPPSQATVTSQADAAHFVIEMEGEPVYVGDLVPRVQEYGVVIGGANKEVNLSSALSRDKRFRSVRYKNRHAWWFRAKAYPGEVNFVEPNPNGVEDEEEDDTLDFSSPSDATQS